MRALSTGSGGGGGGGAGASLIGAYAARPAPSAANKGSIYVCTDPGIVAFISDGSVWHPLLGPAGGGVLGTEVAPGNSLAAYSTINGPSAFAAVTGCARLSGASLIGANHIVGAEVGRGAGVLVKACVFLELVPPAVNVLVQGGVYVRDSATDAAFTIDLTYSTGGTLPTGLSLTASTWTNSTSPAGNISSQLTWQNLPAVPSWLAITDDGTTFHFQYSTDGVTFIDFATDSPAGGTTQFDKKGFFVNPSQSPAAVTAISFA